MKKAYLSIDLDFWMNQTTPQRANEFFSKVFALDVPKLFVVEHEELIDDVDESNADILYNLDFHSDICSENQIYKGESPEDGTWVNFVSWKKQGEYVWICPDIVECYDCASGICHGEDEYDPFKYQTECAWRSIILTQKLKTIDWGAISHVGVCLSPCYSSIDSIKDITKKLGLSEKKLYNLIWRQPLMSPQNRTRGTLSKAA